MGHLFFFAATVMKKKSSKQKHKIIEIKQSVATFSA